MFAAQAPQSIPASQVLQTRYRNRLPSSLGELAGPAQGTVQLPLHIAWSGLTAFDLGQPKPRMTLYRTELAEGQRDDLARYLSRDLLISQWPILRRLISPQRSRCMGVLISGTWPASR